jgi:hypothetical protein
MPVGAEVVRLSGGAVLPGLVDAHLHLAGEALRRSGVDLRGARSLEEVGRRVRAWSARHPQGPVLATGWDDTLLREHRFPSQRELDRWVPERPLLAYRISGHVAVANSAATALAIGTSVIGTAPSGPGGGRAVPGVFLEQGLDAVEPISDAWLESRPRVLLDTLRSVSAMGITSVGSMSARPLEARLLAELAYRRPLPVEVALYPQIQHWRQVMLPADSAGRGVRIRGVKAWLDGALGIRTAALIHPYADAPGVPGALRPEATLVESDQAEIASRGLQLALHAIGDRAVLVALELHARVRSAARPRIEHASVLSPRLVERVVREHPVLVVQPSFVGSDTWLVARLGTARAAWAYPFATLRSRGVVLAGSSDAPVESSDPWEGMRAAMAGRPYPGPVESFPESLAAADALDLYTRGGATALGQEEVGSLAVGAPADFIVVRSRTVESAVRMGCGTVRETWRGARRVYRKGGPRASNVRVDE